MNFNSLLSCYNIKYFDKCLFFFIFMKINFILFLIDLNFTFQVRRHLIFLNDVLKVKVRSLKYSFQFCVSFLSYRENGHLKK